MNKGIEIKVSVLVPKGASCHFDGASDCKHYERFSTKGRRCKLFNVALESKYNRDFEKFEMMKCILCQQLCNEQQQELDK